AAQLLPDAGTGETDLSSFAVNSDSFPDVELVLFGLGEGGDFVVRESSGGHEAGTISTAMFHSGNYENGLRSALESGSGYCDCYADGGHNYSVFTDMGNKTVLAATLNGDRLLDEARDVYKTATTAASVGALAFWAAVLAALFSIRGKVKKASGALDAIAAGNPKVKLVINSGDEFEGLAKSVNSISNKMNEAVAEGAKRGRLYERFIPGDMLALMGVPTPDQAGTETFACRKMFTMSAKYVFSGDISASDDKEIFDLANLVMERISGHISANGGTICRSGAEGFTALFDCATVEAVSAAVSIRQEINGLARDRVRQGLPDLGIYIALDEAQVKMGVVGDERRMEPAVVSAGFDVGGRLLSLFERLDAGILCTDAVAERASDYSSRYLGKTRTGDELVRVYEIIDGDTYGVRSGKLNTAQEFADGVYTIYSRDFAKAKRTFMDITRKNEKDGAARFYLYLADRFDREEPGEISLDY
ncbi:MAG: hypothetical protein IJG63_05530, partial [Oscillospiraceae bacterium]|nr:hypothetical protein [Oscillospiraceae bacterium]